MNIYLVGNNYTEPVNGAVSITGHLKNIEKNASQAYPEVNNIVTIAVNGGPGSGKGSFEGVIVKELANSQKDNVVILIAESARDILDELAAKNKLQETLKQGKLSELIGIEQARRREIAEQLQNNFKGKNIYVIYDRDQSNGEIYDKFFKNYNFATETLNETAFNEDLKKSHTFQKIGNEMKELFDISYCLRPVNHEKNYACANPRMPGAKVDKTRSESYPMAKILHNALEMGAKMVFGEKLAVVENTDSNDPNVSSQTTIYQRAKNQVEGMAQLMNKKKEKNEAARVLENRISTLQGLCHIY